MRAATNGLVCHGVTGRNAESKPTCIDFEHPRLNSSSTSLTSMLCLGTVPGSSSSTA